jgi:hypothetical protein
VQAGHGGVQVHQAVGPVRVGRAEDVVADQDVGHPGHRIPGRGGATAQVQNAIFALVASTSAERSRGKAEGLPRYSQPSTSGVTMRCSRP